MTGLIGKSGKIFPLNFHNPEKMGNIVVNPIGGLANRMRAIASAVSLAKECGIGTVDVYWRVNHELAAKFDDIFLPRPELALHYPSGLGYSLLYSPPRKKNIYLSALSLKRFGLYISDFNAKSQKIMASENADEMIFKETKSAIEAERDCYFQSGCIYYKFMDEEYRKLFRFSDGIDDMATDIIDNLGNDVVGIHIRRTDNSQSILHSPDSLFFEEIDKRIAENPDVRFYLATDDETVKRRFKEKYGDRLATSITPASRTSKYGIIDAAVEMCILSKTKEIIGSHYSSFSEAASIIGGTPLLQVYRPASR